jgi:hypothetical protein
MLSLCRMTVRRQWRDMLQLLASPYQTTLKITRSLNWH